MARNPIEILAEGNRLLHELEKKLTGVNQNLVNISKEARNANLKDYFNVKSPNDVNEKLKLQKTIIEQVNAEIKERNRLEKALSNQLAKNKLAESELAKELAKQRFETRERNKQIRASAVLSSKLSTEYQKLVVRMNQAGRVRQSLIAKQAQGINLSKQEQKELKDSTRDFFRYEKAVKKADASINRYQRNVGNYSSALSKAGAAVRNFAGAFGVLSAIQIGREVFELTKEIDSLDKALKQVTVTQESFNQAQIFLVNLSEEAGVRINDLQRAYTKFLASAKTTNLTLDQTQDIFRQTAKAGAVLGLSTDDINGAFRALEQILSKGKVQAEEIRGQLGERLPGAFQILAKSMGLTTQELSKQLELGNVISEEVLPNFARELEKTFGLEAVNRVDTLTSAQNRLSNSWTNLVRSFSEDSGVLTEVFKDIITFLSNAIEGINILNTSSEKLNEKFANNIQSKFLKETTEAYKELGDEAEAVAESEFIRSEKAIIAIEEEILLLKERNQELNNQNLRGRAGAERSRELRKNADRIKELNVDLAKYTGILKASEIQLGINTKALDNNTEGSSKNNKVKKQTIEVLANSIAYLKNEVKLLTEKREKLATNSREYQQYTRQIEDAEKALADFRLQLEGVSKINSLGDSESALKNITEILTKPKTIEGLEVDGANSEIEQQIKNKKRLEEIERDSAERRKQLEQELAYSLLDLGNALFDAKIQRYDDEIQKNNDYYAALLDNERLTEEQRSALEAERNRKNAQLEKRKREEQRKQAILNRDAAIAEIAINTAIGVSADFKKGAILGGITSALTLAMGAIQTGIVLATPIPKFEKGKNINDNYEGLGIWGEKRRELKISKDGSMELSPKKIANHLTHVKKDDVIIPDAEKFLSNMTDAELYENLHKHSIIASMAHQQQTIDSYLIAQSINKSQQKQTDRLIKAIKENRPKINLHNNNSISEDLAFLSALNKL